MQIDKTYALQCYLQDLLTGKITLTEAIKEIDDMYMESQDLLPQGQRIGQTIINFLCWLEDNGYKDADFISVPDIFMVENQELKEKYQEYLDFLKSFE